MTDFKVGDRVRATLGENVLVGTVQWLGGDGTCDVLIAPPVGLPIHPSDGWHIEKVSPPLPTKVGAIIKTDDGGLFCVAHTGRDGWVQLNTFGRSKITDWFDDDDFAGGGFNVIFEGVDQ